MTEVVYRIVEHDGGWAYKVGDVFSETFPNRVAAEAAASQAAAEQGVPGDPETISWQDAEGQWHEERESGSDRPQAYVAGHGNSVAAAAPRGIDRKPPLTLTHLLLAGAAGALLATLISGRRGPSS